MLLGIPGFTQLGIIILVTVFLLLIPLFALIDVLRNEFTGSNKIIWVLLIIFLPFLGAMLYFLIGGNQKIRR